MRGRNLIILLLSLAAVAGVAALILMGKGQGPRRSVQGSSLLPHLPVGEVASVTIKSAGNSVSLVKQEDGWVIRQRFDYPADLSKIAGLVHELEEAKVGRKFEGSEEILKRLALKDPGDPQASEVEKGIRVVLSAQGEKVLASVLLGGLWQGAPLPDTRRFVGRYLRLAESNTVYLVDGKFQGVKGDPASWFDHQLVEEVNPAEVKRITCGTSDGKRTLYTFERRGPGKQLEAASLPPSVRFKADELRQLANGLASLVAEDVAGPAAGPAAAAFPLRIDYQLFDGTNYRVYFCRDCSQNGKNQCLLRLEASYEEPAADKKEEAAGQGKGAEKRAKGSAEELAAEAKRLNERVNPWIYVVPWTKYYAFHTNLHLFLGPVKKSGEK